MSNNTIQPPVSKSKPIRVALGVAAATTVIATGLPQLTPEEFDWIGAAVGLLGLVIVAFTGKFAENSTVPYETVKSMVNDETGDVVAGPAAALRTGTVVEEPVAAGPSPYSPPTH